jgi:MFS family permease
MVLAFQSNLLLVYLGHGFLVAIGVSLGSHFTLTTMVNDWFVKRRSLALSLVMSSMGAGGYFLIPKLMESINIIGWRYAYLISAAAIFLTGVILVGLFMKNKPEDIGQVPDGIFDPEPEKIDTRAPTSGLYRTPVAFTPKEAFATRTLWLLIIFYVLFMFTGNAKITHAVAFYYDLGLTSVQAADIVGISSLIMVLSQLSIGFAGLRYDMHRVAVIGFMLVVIGMVILVYANTLTMIYVYALLNYIGTGANFVAMMNLLANYYGAKNYPVIMGYVAPCWALPASLGAPFAGYIRDTMGSYVPAWKIFVILLFIALILLIFAKPPVHPSLKGKQQEGM